LSPEIRASQATDAKEQKFFGSFFQKRTASFLCPPPLVRRRVPPYLVSIHGAGWRIRMSLSISLTVNTIRRDITLDDPRVTLLDLLRGVHRAGGWAAGKFLLGAGAEP
jgi:hypothetical protein